MHATTLANLASTIAIHGTHLLNKGDTIPATALQEYWVASRNRASRWHQVLGMYREYQDTGDVIGMRSWWDMHQQILEEIMVSEILTRVVAAIGEGLDEWEDEPEVSPVAHSVFVSHLEARNRVLQIMVASHGASTKALTQLNRLRQTTEKWVDLLIGQIVTTYPSAVKYGYVLERTTAFADDMSDLSISARQTAGWLTTAAMQDSLTRQVSSTASCTEENQRICDAMLVCLRPDLFDSCGSLQSLWMYRLKHVASETGSVVQTLLSPRPDAGLLNGYEEVRGPQFQKRLR